MPCVFEIQKDMRESLPVGLQASQVETLKCNVRIRKDRATGDIKTREKKQIEIYW